MQNRQGSSADGKGNYIALAIRSRGSESNGTALFLINTNAHTLRPVLQRKFSGFISPAGE